MAITTETTRTTRTPRTPDTAAPGRGRRTTLWTFVVASIAAFMSSLDNLVVTTALPAIRSSLHTSLANLEWTVNAYTLVSRSCCCPPPPWATGTAAAACSASA